MSQRPLTAGEPLKLALASPGISSTLNNPNSPKVPTKSTTTDTNSFALSFNKSSANSSLASPASRLSSDPAELTHVSFALTKKPRVPSAGSLAALFNQQPGNGNFGFSNFEAGYGQAYEADSIVLRGRNGTAMEEPRYIFFKKIVKF